MKDKKHIVYGASRGEYSDYRVCAIFSSYKKAKGYIIKSTIAANKAYGEHANCKNYSVEPNKHGYFIFKCEDCDESDWYPELYIEKFELDPDPEEEEE